MHTVIHLGLSVGFALVLGVVLVLFIANRPGGNGRLSRASIVGLMVAGLILAVVFFATSKAYVPPTAF